MKPKIRQKSGICIVQVPDGVNFGTADEEKSSPFFSASRAKGRSPAIGPTNRPLCSDIDNVVELADALDKEEIAQSLTVA